MPRYHERAARLVANTNGRRRSALTCGSVGSLVAGLTMLGLTAAVGTVGVTDAWRAGDVITPASAGRKLLEVEVSASAVAILVIATFLVAFGILFDVAVDYLFEHTGRHIRPVLDSLFSELTLLGFIGLIMFLVERTKSLNGYSEHLFGEGEQLDDLVETVHMALFLIMVLFLLVSIVLLQVAKRLQREWHSHEVEAMFVDNIVDHYAEYLVESRTHGSRVGPFFRTLFCGERHVGSAFGKMVHTVLREAFLRELYPSLEDGDGLDEDDDLRLVEQLLEKAAHMEPVVLTKATSSVYRKSIQVYAFETDSRIEVHKNWGVSKGNPDDWIICGSGGDVYMNSNAEFMENYEPVGPSAPNKYRKKTTVFARKMRCSFVASKPNGDTVMGKKGYYLVQSRNKDGTIEQYTMDPSVFSQQYEPVVQDTTTKESELQYADFNLGHYFSILMGSFLGEVVDIRLYTWIAVEVCLLIFFGIVTALDRAFFVGALFVAGWALVLVLRLVLGKLQRIRDALLDQTLFLRAEIQADMLLQEQRRKAATTAAPKKHTLKSPLIDTSNGEGVTLTNGGAKSTRRKGALKRTVSSRMPPVDKRRPPYELLNLKKPRTGCSKRCFGRAANRHELLFWFDHNGPDFLEHLVRTSMMLLAVYVAVVGVLFHEYECQDSWSKCVLYYLAALVAPIVQLLYLPRVTRLYVVVTSVEMMKHRQVMDEVVRIERASKCLRALRLVSAIKGKVRKEGGSPRHGAKMDLAAAHKEVRKAHGSRAPSLGPVDESKAVENGAGAGVGAGALEKPASERVYGSQTSARYLKRRSELFEAFAMFDRDNSGEVNTDELEGVLSMLGLRSEAQELATRIVTEIDVDGSGTVSFNEFFEWIAELDMENSSDTQELDEKIFEIIDKDGDGTITVDELRAAILSMGEVMSYRDVVQLVREADKDGDGQIDLEEFVTMMRRHSRYSDHL